LRLIDRTGITNSSMYNIAYHQERYFIGQGNNTILVIDSNNLTRINTISASELNGPRDIIFLDDGRVMVVSSVYNNRLLFFQRSNTSSTEYTFFSREYTNFSSPHGLWYVNNSCFYVVSWANAAIYSYTSLENKSWKAELLVNASAVGISSAGSHLLTDECERIWLVSSSNGIFIFDNEGNWLHNVNYAVYGISDIWRDDNYVVYLSDNANGRILRVDPQLTC
jgi:DNA-binding beta-propeller fold protein YncE